MMQGFASPRRGGKTRHSPWEGVRLGLAVATTIWMWIAVVDAVAGQPWRTFTVLGGVAVFTVLHYVLNVAYGAAILSAVHGAEREPSLAIAVLFGFLIIEFAFAMLTVLLAHAGLGQLAWLRILGGNLIGAVVGFWLLSRRHRLAREMRAAEEEEND
jgi:hypothetical protein